MRYTIGAGDIMPLLVFFYLSALVFHYLITGSRMRHAQYVLLTCFFVYAMLGTFLVFFPIRIRLGDFAPTGELSSTAWYSTLNLVPFEHLTRRNFILNIWLMVPLGALLPLLRPQIRTVFQMGAFAFLVSFGIELLQFLMWVGLGSRRVTDVNDLIANTLGGVLGYVVLRVLLLFTPLRQVFEESPLPATTPTEVSS